MLKKKIEAEEISSVIEQRRCQSFLFSKPGPSILAHNKLDTGKENPMGGPKGNSGFERRWCKAG